MNKRPINKIIDLDTSTEDSLSNKRIHLDRTTLLHDEEEEEIRRNDQAFFRVGNYRPQQIIQHNIFNQRRVMDLSDDDENDEDYLGEDEEKDDLEQDEYNRTEEEGAEISLNIVKTQKKLDLTHNNDGVISRQTAIFEVGEDDFEEEEERETENNHASNNNNQQANFIDLAAEDSDEIEIISNPNSNGTEVQADEDMIEYDPVHHMRNLLEDLYEVDLNNHIYHSEEQERRDNDQQSVNNNQNNVNNNNNVNNDESINNVNNNINTNNTNNTNENPSTNNNNNNIVLDLTSDVIDLTDDSVTFPSSNHRHHQDSEEDEIFRAFRGPSSLFDYIGINIMIMRNFFQAARNHSNPPPPPRPKRTKDDMVPRKPIEGSCPICLEDMNEGNELDYCKYGCGNNVHTKCFKKWNKDTCVMCRDYWD